MCTSEIRERMATRRGLRGLSSGGYEGGGAFATKAMALPSSRRRSARLPQVPLLGIDEDGAI
jgi:hypothetical protein